MAKAQTQPQTDDYKKKQFGECGLLGCRNVCKDDGPTCVESGGGKRGAQEPSQNEPKPPITSRLAAFGNPCV